MFKFYYIFLLGFVSLYNAVPLCSEQIYNWVDDNGVKNYTNLPSNVPGKLFTKNRSFESEAESSAEYVSNYDLEQQRKDYFVRLKRLQAQRELINQIRDIVEREQNLRVEYEQKQRMAIETKRDFDKKIIQGYFADKSIIELKKFEVAMENIDQELQLLIPRKKKLMSIARKQGISDEF